MKIKSTSIESKDKATVRGVNNTSKHKRIIILQLQHIERNP